MVCYGVVVRRKNMFVVFVWRKIVSMRLCSQFFALLNGGLAEYGFVLVRPRKAGDSSFLRDNSYSSFYRSNTSTIWQKLGFYDMGLLRTKSSSDTLRLRKKFLTIHPCTNYFSRTTHCINFSSTATISRGIFNQHSIFLGYFHSKNHSCHHHSRQNFTLTSDKFLP